MAVLDLIVRQGKVLNAIAVERGQTLAQMALAWVLRDKKVTSVRIGLRKVVKLKSV